MQNNSIQAIVTDIEGTTSSISFVHEILFPYAAKNLTSYLNKHAQDKEIVAILQEVKSIANAPLATLPQLIDILTNWIAEDKKLTPLKQLQGLIWEHGYRQQDFKGHLYQDAYQHIKQWKAKGLKLYIYSSGSEQAQRLLFQFSEFGDLSPYIDGYFDTRIGGKKESTSYQNIIAKLACPATEILFLSDVEAELDAAQRAGMKTTLLARYAGMAAVNGHRIAKDFSEIEL